MARMVEATSGERHGSTFVFRDPDGRRHAVRVSSILAASDIDESQDATLLQLPGSRFLMVRSSLDNVLPWLSSPQPIAMGPSRLSDDEVRRMRLVVSNLRAVWQRTMSTLLEEGLLPTQAFRAMRDECVEAARSFAGSGGDQHKAIGAEGARDILDLFAHLLPEEHAVSFP